MTPKDLRALCRAIGVSRVAQVTGLDRTGVHVACAVRPGGHVLQVCNGKGETPEAASAGAVLEAAELWASETERPELFVWGTAAEARRGPGLTWLPSNLGSAGALVAPELDGPRTRLAWATGVELVSQAEVRVPAQALHCPPAGSPPLGPALVRWTTNGMGAHWERDRALLHALLEAVERDHLGRILPEGWVPDVVEERLLGDDLPPRVAAWESAIRRRGFDVFLFDLTPVDGFGLPVAGALLFDAERGPVPLTAGYACALDPAAALLGALLEAAQSRLTDIHGAREDVAPGDREGAARLWALCGAVDAVRSAADMPKVAARSPGRALQAVIDAFAHRREPVGAFDLTPGAPVHVLKVVAPGLRTSDLL